jgi:large subunit ribosomal protein L3
MVLPVDPKHTDSLTGTVPLGRVLKGRRMAGHMGDNRVTARHLTVFRANPERNLLLVRGAVPGARNGLLLIRKSGKMEKESADSSS